MVAKLHIPYGFGDCVNGFDYEGHITSVEYAKRMRDDYYKHRIGVDDMMLTSFRRNIARNNYQKENNKYRQQKQEFGCIPCYFDDKDYNPMTVDNFIEHFENGDGFVLVIRVFNKKTLTDEPDLETDIKSWMRECVRIERLPISTDKKFKSLSKKDLKITFSDDSKMAAILKDCKMVNVYSNLKFALWVNKVIFITDENKIEKDKK